MNNIQYLFKQFFSKETQENELTLQYWEIYITEGIYAAIHNQFTKITEIHVRELGLSFNQAGASMFKPNSDRYTSKSFKCPKPNLLKTVIISKNSEAGQAILWLNDCFKNKEVEEAKLKQLFDILL